MELSPSQLQPPFNRTYRKHYEDGQAAAREGYAAKDNPHPVGSAACQGWADGFYDETHKDPPLDQRSSPGDRREKVGD
jgi:hypothetical protein